MDDYLFPAPLFRDRSLAMVKLPSLPEMDGTLLFIYD